MRYLYIGFSILCFALSGVITLKALNLPEKNPLNPAALSQVKPYTPSHVVKEILTEPLAEQAPLNPPAEKLQNTTSQPEQKHANESAASQINSQTLLDTVKQLEQKLSEKNASSQTAMQTADNTTTLQQTTKECTKPMSLFSASLMIHKGTTKAARINSQNMMVSIFYS